MQKAPLNLTMLKKRNPTLDLYRGLAVLLMMIFHFCWDLREFNHISYHLTDPFWVYFRSIILFLFLTAIGWSAYISKSQNCNQSQSNILKRFLMRQGKLLLAAVSISLITYITFPSQWIYFGILHFIFILSFIHYPFASLPIISASIGLFLFLIYQLTDWLLFPNIHYLITNDFGAPKYTLDIIYPFPWVTCIFIGPLIGKALSNVHLQTSLLTNLLSWLGQHALNIYLIHQLILYTAVKLTTDLLSHLN
ncbi:heparan-alpha-glucosaminide N-acetyltransferase [Marinomonas phaeophyticola]|nr:heparan-alpha-glucosaminide N-acetyltransferase [Marinomonas sp. 15G1-11]